nr:MAG TPA: hypothetical protein [Caudoviricetes sp.]
MAGRSIGTGAFLLSPRSVHSTRANAARQQPAPGGACGMVPPGLPKTHGRPLFGSFLGPATVRGAEGPAFFSRKIPEKWAVTLRIDGAGPGRREPSTP